MLVIEELESQVQALIARCQHLQQENKALKHAQFEIEQAYNDLEQRSQHAGAKLRHVIADLKLKQEEVA